MFVYSDRRPALGFCRRRFLKIFKFCRLRTRSIHFQPQKSPKNVAGIDRVLINTNIQQNERKAVEHAILLRNKCTELEQKCRDMETEKEAVRFFWRDKLLEGQSRAARILT